VMIALEFATQNYDEVRRMIRGDHGTPVILLPIGSVEAHGPHLPVDTDTRIATRLSQTVAKLIRKRKGMFPMIAVPFVTTASAFAEGFRGTVSYSAEFEETSLKETIRTLRNQVGPRVCLVNLHFDPVHMSAMKVTVDWFNGVGQPVLHCPAHGGEVRAMIPGRLEDGRIARFARCGDCGTTFGEVSKGEQTWTHLAYIGFDASLGRYKSLDSSRVPEEEGLLQDVLSRLPPPGDPRWDYESPNSPPTVFPDFTERQTAARIGGEFATGSCHGGDFETSLLLAASPQLVASNYKTLARKFVDLPKAIREGKKSFRDVGMFDTYCGDPASATAEKGEKLYAMLAEIVVEKCLRAWPAASG